MLNKKNSTPLKLLLCEEAASEKFVEWEIVTSKFDGIQPQGV